MSEYLEKHNIHAIFNEVIEELSKNQPENPVQFSVNYLIDKYLNLSLLQSRKGANTPNGSHPGSPRVGELHIHETNAQTENRAPELATTGHTNSPTDSNTPIATPTLPPKKPSPIRMSQRRGAICAEPIGNEDDDKEPRVRTPKTKEQQERLDMALKKHIMFAHLEEEEKQAIFDAMSEVSFKEGDVVIKQGDEGDNFYVVDSGECDIYVAKEGEPPQHVAVVGKDGSFGELALIYGSPRAATVIAKTDCTFWAIDRVTYRKVVMKSTVEKRKMYESFLERVPILSQLTKWERMIIADALEPHTFEVGETVVREGDPGDRFYIITEGEAAVYQARSSGLEHMVTLKKSDYFGEIALLTNRPRAATVVATTPLKCVGLDRERFNRVLGPCDNILRRNMDNYNKYMASKI